MLTCPQCGTSLEFDDASQKTVAQPAKGNLFKGPFHIPRMMTKSIELAAAAT